VVDLRGLGAGQVRAAERRGDGNNAGGEEGDDDAPSEVPVSVSV
jgi:hypothetical protein